MTETQHKRILASVICLIGIACFLTSQALYNNGIIASFLYAVLLVISGVISLNAVAIADVIGPDPDTEHKTTFQSWLENSTIILSGAIGPTPSGTTVNRVMLSTSTYSPEEVDYFIATCLVTYVADTTASEDERMARMYKIETMLTDPAIINSDRTPAGFRK